MGSSFPLTFKVRLNLDQINLLRTTDLNAPSASFSKKAEVAKVTRKMNLNRLVFFFLTANSGCICFIYSYIAWVVKWSLK